MTQQQPGQPGQQDGLTDVGDLFFQFTSPGDMLIGNYLGSLPIVWPDGNPGKQHFMETADGVYKFTGSFNLDNALAMTAEGSYTEITYKGDQPTRRGLNPVKIFGVRTAQTKSLPMPQPALPGMAPAQPPQIGQGKPQQYYVGGMPATQARPPYPQNPNPNATAAGTLPPGVLQYLPDGTAVYGFTPDGSPLDQQGRLIGQAMQG